MLVAGDSMAQRPHELPGTVPTDAALGVRATPARPGFTAVSLLPLLLLVALLVQSVADSRLLVEYGMFLLVIVPVKTKSSRD